MKRALDVSLRVVIYSVTATAVGLLVASKFGVAFTSCPPGFQKLPGGFFNGACVDQHLNITLDANNLLHLSQLTPGEWLPTAAITRVADADRNVDIQETSFQHVTAPTGQVVFTPTLLYDPTHHFDHPPGIPTSSPNITEDQQAFLNARTYLLSQRDLVVQDLGIGKCQQTQDALDALGRALHAIQDAYSHSNYVDGLTQCSQATTRCEQATFDSALLDPTISPPSLLLLTLYGKPVPNNLNANFENPDGLCTQANAKPYCHLFWSKDFLNKNTESQTYNLQARAAAVAASVRLIEDIISRVGKSTWMQTVVNYPNSCSPAPPCPACSGGGNQTGLSGQSITSGDPNDKAGSQGVGAQQFISGATPLRYAVQFGNETTASAAAQKVMISDLLDTTNDDLRTFTLGPISFLGQFVQPPLGPGDFSKSVDLRPGTDLLVAINTHLDRASGTLTYTFQSIDPATAKPPADPSVGFLPPGANGSVFFTVQPKQGLPTNTRIQNQATVVFDVNAPIQTPTWLNTLDNTPPTSSVLALPPTQSCQNFNVTWSGTDVGAGVQDFTIFVSDNGGPFAPWLTNTTATSASFSGHGGHSYAFYSIARDRTGNIEKAKTSAETTTEVSASPVCGRPSLSGKISSTALSGNTMTLAIQLTNIGTVQALNIQIAGFGLRTLAGTGTVSYAGPLIPFPFSIGNLAAGTSKTITVALHVPSTVTKFSITEDGRLQDTIGNTYNYSIGQVVYP